MNKFKDHIIMAAVLVALGLIGIFMSEHQVTATTPPAVGPNLTIAGPLPLPVSINGTVSLTPGGTVQIANPASAPVLVRNVDAVSAEPFQASTGMDLSSGDGLSNLVTVPANKRLVIEHASLSIEANAPYGLGLVRILISGSGASDAISCTLIGQAPNLQNYSCTTQTKLYAEAGQSVGLEVALGYYVGYGSAAVMLSGYYVPVP